MQFDIAISKNNGAAVGSQTIFSESLRELTLDVGFFFLKKGTTSMKFFMFFVGFLE